MLHSSKHFHTLQFLRAQTSGFFTVPYSGKIWWALNLAKWLYFDIGKI